MTWIYKGRFSQSEGCMRIKHWKVVETKAEKGSLASRWQGEGRDERRVTRECSRVRGSEAVPMPVSSGGAGSVAES